MRPWLIVAGVVVAAATAAVILRGSGESAEARIARILDDAVRAVEERDLGDLIANVSSEFRGSHGTDRDDVKGLLFLRLQRSDWRRVFVLEREIDVAEDDRAARVRTTVVLAGGDNLGSVTDVAPTDAAAYAFDLRLELEEDDEWRVVAASYERARFQNFLERLQP